MSILAPGHTAQLVRFCLVGFTCFSFNIAAIAAFHELMGMNLTLAYVIVFVLGNLLGYWLNKRFTFAMRGTLDQAAAIRYLIVNTAALLFSIALLHVLVDRLHLWYITATVLIAAINAPLTFLAQRMFTYRMTS